MNYLVIDVEMCKVPKHYRTKDYTHAKEIIQIGAVLLDEHYSRIDTLSQYVHPEHGVIDHFIKDLTGIQNSQVKRVPRLKEALFHMLDWIGERPYRVYAWSDTDRAQLLREVCSKNIQDERIASFLEEERWVDYQDVFVKRYDFPRQISLTEALERAGIEPESRLHDGLNDAIHTGYLIERLELNPDYQLVSYEFPETDSKSFCGTLGELFAGLGL